MKNLYKLCSFLLVVFMGIVLLAGCGSSVRGSMTITPKRVSIDVEITISDPKDECGTVSCSLYSIEDDEEELVKTSSITISSSNTGSTTFSSLTEENEYKLVLYANVGGKKVTLDKQTVSTSQSGAEDDPILISNYSELLDVSKDNEAYYELAADIDCGGDDIVPFFDSSTKFKGHFDGKGYTISNFGFFQDASTSTSYKQYSGLFGYNQGTITNVNLKDVFLNSSRGGDTYLGIICGKNEGEISNVTLDNVTLTAKSTGSGWQYIGCITGYNGDKSKVINCNVTNLKMTLTTKNKLQVGGLVGSNAEPSIKKYAPVVENSSVSGTISINQNATYTSSINNYVGGLVGFTSSKVNDCYTNIKIEMTASKTSSSVTEYINYVGGIIGYGKAGKLLNCAAIADISYTSGDVFDVSVGGLVGYVDDHASIENSVFVTAGSAISVTCRVASYATSTSTSDERYVKLSDETYKSLNDLYILENEEYKQLTSSTIVSGQEVYIKDGESYLKLESTVSTATLYKYIENSNAYASTIAGLVYGDGDDMSEVVAYQTGSLDITVGESCVVTTKNDYEVKTSFEGLSETVATFIAAALS